MIGKLIVWALDWEGAVKKARRALDEFYIEGLVTNIPLHREIVRDEDFKAGRFTTNFLDKKLKAFNLHATSALAEEEKRVAQISELIETIKKHQLTTRS